MSAGSVLLAGSACICLGMAVAFLGILAPALFLPGTWLILLGLLACAAAAVPALAAARRVDGDVS